MSIKTLLDSLYTSSGKDETITKTAEDALISAIRGDSDEDEVDEADLASMSTEELLALAEELGVSTDEEVVDQEKVAAEQEIDETAAEMLGGQVMAHAMVHEMSLIKEAMQKGLCRVCKTNQMDLVGSSICSACAQGE